MERFVGVRNVLKNSSYYYIICISKEGLYTYVNDKYAGTFKHVVDDFVGKPAMINMHPDDVNIVLQTAYQCFADPENLFPVAIRKNNGKGGYIITQWEFKSMVVNGEPEGVFCIGYDVTEYVHELNKKEDLLKSIAFHQSHIIRRPLANMLGILSILQKNEFDDNIKNLMQILFDNATELDQVVRMIVKNTE